MYLSCTSFGSRANRHRASRSKYFRLTLWSFFVHVCVGVAVASCSSDDILTLASLRRGRQFLGTSAKICCRMSLANREIALVRWRSRSSCCWRMDDTCAKGGIALVRKGTLVRKRAHSAGAGMAVALAHRNSAKTSDNLRTSFHTERRDILHAAPPPQAAAGQRTATFY